MKILHIISLCVYIGHHVTQALPKCSKHEVCQTAEGNERQLDWLKKGLSRLSEELMRSQFRQEQRVRSEGWSGIQQIRQRHSGERNYYVESHTGYEAGGIYDTPNSDRSVGIGELEAVLNGVHFRTRRNNYPLHMNHKNSSEFWATQPIDFPEVPEAVLNKTTVKEPNPECWGDIIAEFLGDSTAILSVTTNSIYPDEISYTYLWSTGETTSTILVNEDDTYCVTVVDSYGCEFSTCLFVSIWDIPWANAIFGYVHGDDFVGNLDATIEIYKVVEDETVELYSDGIETNDGLFVVNDVPDGKYIVLAYADAEGYVPTYGYSTSSWEEAHQYEVDGNATSVPVLSIEMIPIETVEGYGSIQGMVSTDNIVANDTKDETRSSVPLEGANIMLMHNAAPVGQLFTDDEGNFSFINLPFGTYEVILEIPGFPRKVLVVVLSEENPNVTDVDFETELISTSTQNTSALSALTLSPNPTSHTLVVDFEHNSRKELEYRLTDMHGKLIMSSVMDINSGENTLQLDVSSLKNGVYNLVLQTNEERVAKRFIKL